MKRICVFAGSNVGASPEFEQGAVRLGQLLAEQNIELVYGGSKIGLMGSIADSVLQSGGKVTGVMPKNLFKREIIHPLVTEFHETETMHERKALMSELADGYIALPGGIGTFEELFEVLCWAQIGIHKKPIGALNVLNYYDPVSELIKKAATAGFMPQANVDLLIIEKQPEMLLEKMFNQNKGIRTEEEIDL
ncbi:TIGR00730 family Rossman fold protein [Alkalihalobacterium chitinilyticum]|uniref:Cytokinin riboside 5'-monophosphate phosphoribohydrolase n=1 Tax=Alkalihalobacterium chitinilyticum TaxID=2980103 RepID=A0ABT5VGQ3_9BACI|nr:TIGR00730 family Rossman fold protein [Alkalihalobacterium chitinilyticum]MDE5414621.1 TIGR00730 family Rossman fold protein [Alkalihalobacterium chitinilyticum]